MNAKNRRATYDRSNFFDASVSEYGTDGNDWFTDEVAIDFPSMARMLGRIQKDFFGLEQRELSLSTEVVLTVAEAFRGVKIPVDVPVRHTCPVCGGRGEILMDPCTLCWGRGERLYCYSIQVSVPPRVQHGTRLSVPVTLPYAPSMFVEVRIAIQ